MTFIQTFKGGFFDFAMMHKHPLDIEDIAHALSQICRFGGHSREFYSVAQHSVYVSQLVSGDNKLAGLMHDAPEAYLGDMVSPLKRRMPEYKYHEGLLWATLAKQYGLPKELPEEVKAADLIMLAAEARDLMGYDATIWGIPPAPESIRVVPWPSKVAEKHFLEAFRALTSEYTRAMAVAIGPA
jgi:hypothetical protein